MTHRHAAPPVTWPPPVAAWLLELFCPSAEYDSVAGDLLEQYRLGRGRFWYWRQVLAIVVLGIYHRALRRPLAPKIDVLGLPRIYVNRPMTGAVTFPKVREREVRETPVHLHRGINSTSVASEGFQGLPGLLMTIAFVFIFLGIFWPRNNDWLGVLFFAAEIGAALIYVIAGRRERKDSEESRRVLHQINEERDRKNASPTHTK